MTNSNHYVPACNRRIKFFAPNMCQQARSRILLVLLVLGAPLTVCAQSPEPSAKFSVQPGGPDSKSSVGYPGEVFTFTAEVNDAVRYEVNFDDDHDPISEAAGTAVFQRTYKKPGDYTAILQAWNAAGLSLLEPALTLAISVKERPAAAQPPASVVVEIEVPVSVQTPPPVVQEQWPKVRLARSEPTVRPEPTKPDILPWLLLAAIAILLSRKAGSTGADLGTFEPTRDRGRVEVIGSPTADDAVSIRVRQRHAPEFVISVDNGERQ